MRSLDLFSGIGGMALGLERAGIEAAAFCEIEPYCQKVLKKHWLDVPCYPDIKTLTAEKLHADGITGIDLIAGGFPCQDISNAGKRAGIDGERSGLWSEYHRIICELRPRYVLVENVSALLGRGISRVLGDLAESGYDAEWDCISARAVGSIHQRDRIFIIAYNSKKRIERISSKPLHRFNTFSWCKDVRRVEDLRKRSDLPEPLFCGGRDGIPYWVDRLAGLGNAVVPQVAEFIGRQIIRNEGK